MSSLIHNLFFGFLLPVAVGQTVADMAAGFVKDHRFQRPDLQDLNRLHLTLCNVWMGPAPLPEGILNLAYAVGKAASAASGDFEIEMEEIDCISRVPPQNPVLVIKPRKGVANTALRPFQRALAAQMRLRGLQVEGRFSPHVTLAYYDSCPYTPPRLVKTVRWQAGELVLIDSHVGQHHYEFLGRWPLLPTQASDQRPDSPQTSLF